jgi:signal transduction histidine kinase/ActR/RegA family two-component response regulator
MKPGRLNDVAASLELPPKWLDSAVKRYLLPFVTLILALCLQGVLQAVLPKGKDFPYAFFHLFGLFVVAWFAGYGPGVVSCLLTMVAIPAAVVPGFRLSAIDLSRLTLLMGVSLLITKVARTQRHARAMLREANSNLDQRVQARTIDLAETVQALESEVAQHKNTERRLQTQLERLSLLDQITRAIGERQDLQSVFQVVVRSLEDRLPIDFGCVCLYDSVTEKLKVTCVGIRSEGLAMQLALTEEAYVSIDQNGLSRCVRGELVYEPDLSQLDFPFPRRLASGGLGSVVAAPLLVESKVFGLLIAARHQSLGFSSSDCEFLRQLSEHVALAAHQSQIYTALQQAYDDLRQTQQIVMQQERLRALGQMASGIAHDINNAISPVALYTELLLEKEPNLSVRTREYLKTTQTAIEDVAHTVSRMREFYRQREPQLILLPVDASHLAQQVLDLTRARWSDMPQKRGIVIQMNSELAPDLPPIAGVESEIREALINLVFNAVDAMPEGGTLTVRTKTSAAGQGHIDVEVADSGIGMDEETRRRCLEPFFTTKGERGTGLGLAMVYGVTQRHNAEVEIDSARGKGTTIRMRFPVVTADNSGASEIFPAEVIPSRQRILIVDDDPLLIKSLRDALESDGHAVIAAHGGQEGINLFQAAEERKEPFAVVITDLGMPYVDGRKVASAVKTTCPSTPVILLTGWGQRIVAEGDVPPHVNRVLSKPPKLRELRAALAEIGNSKT